ncbi:MAG: hypothetical protein ACJ74W_13805 [Pyrinomonadaceae bacterium]
MTEESARRPETEPSCTHIEVETENGYRIARVCEQSGGTSAAPGAYRFRVTDQAGRTCTVVVEFAPVVVAAVAGQRGRPLAAHQPYWLACAEHTLATYLWEHDACPPAEKLLVKEACMDDVALALRWDD